MTIRKPAIFLLTVILSYVCAQKVAAAQDGETQPTSATSSASKPKLADKAVAAKPESAASDQSAKDKSAKDKDATDKGGKENDKDAKDKKDGESSDPLSSGTFGGLKFRSVGPALISGRVVSIAVNPQNKSHYFIGVASGGVWRTDNDGTTWQPVFEHEGSYSIGTVVIDPNHSNIVWVGTGENNSQRSVSYGDGVYRSEDGGKTWKNMGLKKSEHIARIIIDPRDSNVVYVASQGPLWGPGGDRGLYKSADGGKTWNAILTFSENTGVTDVVMDPSNPDVLFAASYQRRRHFFTAIDGGPEAGIHKSVDGGKTWIKLSGGLPTVEMGRIGLAISPVNPNIVYASIEAGEKKGGIYRSVDSGVNWEKRNDYDPGPQYYATLFADPKREDRLYAVGVLMQYSDDGGKTIQQLPTSHVHVDFHVLWVDPDDVKHMLIGNDGGLYTTRDGGTSWRWMSNLPTGQFYDVTVDNSKPFYYIYGGTQDNYSLGGPSRTRDISGINNQDWFVTQGGDGFRSLVDPEDPNTVYAEAQNGNLVRFDRATGERFGIQPHEGKDEMPERWNWDSPFIISAHSHTRLYFGGNRIFRTDDRGNTWKAISNDLTRHLNRDAIPVMGKLWSPDSVNKNVSTAFYGNVSAISESPVKEGVLYAGTDDGLIQVTEDGGGHWQRIENFPGVPSNAYVSRIVASRFDDKLVYATFENHQNSDFKPYVLRSADRGKTWTSIAANLPENGPVWALAEDTVNHDLLFLGTEYGIWFSLDAGKKWLQLKGGLPVVAVRDAVIQQRESDLVLATFGRSFYVLDDITPLRSVDRRTLEQEAVLFPVRDSLLYIQSARIGGRNQGFLGETFYVAPNPPYGAIFTYYLKDKYKTLKEIRQDAEKKAAKEHGNAYPALPYPTNDRLREEAEEQAPAVWLTVRDESGNVVRQIPGTNEKGINRAAWDLRYPASTLPPAQEDPIAAIFEESLPTGTLAMPGTFTVRLSRKVRDQWTDLSQPQRFRVYTEAEMGINPESLAELHKFQRRLASLDRAATAAISYGNEMNTRLGSINRALAQTPADTLPLRQEADALIRELTKLMISLRGDQALNALNEQTPTSIISRIRGIASDERLSSSAPSAMHKAQYEIASSEFADALKQLKALAARFEALQQRVEQTGAPWTSGRLPEWEGEQEK
ncbi:MAG TPA: glycosyl hydrolase [Terriglobales bacterium]